MGNHQLFGICENLSLFQNGTHWIDLYHKEQEMIIPIHHTETVPMMNCWEWYVFAEYWDSARTCMTKEEYDVKQAYNDQVWQYVWIGFIWAIILSWIIVYFMNK